MGATTEEPADDGATGMEAARDAVDKTEIEAKLDELRREKDSLETAVTETSQQRDRAEFELRKYKDEAASQLQDLEFSIQERSEKISQLEGKISKLTEENTKIRPDMEDLQNSVTELEEKCQNHLTDKRELRATLSELQKNNTDLQVGYISISTVLLTHPHISVISHMKNL